MEKQSGQTTLPTYQEEMRSIKASLVNSKALALLFIDASKIDKIEQGFGKEVVGKILKELTDVILSPRGKEIRTSDLIALYGVEGEQFLVFLSGKMENRQYQELDALTSLGASFGQGYLISRPSPEFISPYIS